MNHRAYVLILSLITVIAASAQEKSVKPGINDAFRNPNVKEWVEKFEGESRETFEKRKEVVEACQIKPGQVVADIGAGTGLYTRLFAKEVDNKGKVYAVDISQKFLDHIDKSCQSLQLKNVKTILGKDASPELPENSIDMAFICDTYHHFEFPYKMLTSIHQAMKPKGRLVIIDFIRVPGQSREWVLGHVRAGQDVVEQEIIKSGFKKVNEVKSLFKENYFVVFEKAEESKSNSKP
ncbi:MAG TPA: methyltransferase domain-containing protein [Gemmatales bacterium]|nr:methyltransferase domain-containing protein [Gemmatales bacterium]